MSEASRIRMSNARTGKPSGRKGKSLSEWANNPEQARRRMSESSKGRVSNRKGCKLSNEHKTKISDSLKGNNNAKGKKWKLSEITKEKMRVAALSRVNKKFRKFMSEINKGKKLSVETK